MLEHITIGSRQSTLAKLQSYSVGIALKKKFPGIKVKYVFQESSGDKDLTSPLWKMQEKGVFTKDLQKLLLKKEIDVIVHSWKDLDLEERDGTEVYSVLEREDQRDVFFLKKSFWKQFISQDENTPGDRHIKPDHFSINGNQPGALTICTSSPRREHNLTAFFPDYLPSSIANLPLQFESIRGNIQTRLDKFLSNEHQSGLIMAKAGLDRLLSFPNQIEKMDSDLIKEIPPSDLEEFKIIAQKINNHLMHLLWMVIPLSKNPNAPAQGNLAAEFRRGDTSIGSLLKELIVTSASETAMVEREILSGFGGGCHQKIGVSILKRKWGNLEIGKGITEDGKSLDFRKIRSKENENFLQTISHRNFSPEEIWPPNLEMVERNREDLSLEEDMWEKLVSENDLFVARKSALPSSVLEKIQIIQSDLQDSDKEFYPIIWTAGNSTWKNLAKRGLWVHGTNDSLGEKEPIALQYLLNRKTYFVKLTHDQSRDEDSVYPTIQTYKTSLDISLLEQEKKYDPNLVKICFWRSGSEFDALINIHPHWMENIHCCGLGSTYDYLVEKGLNPVPYWSFQDWVADLTKATKNNINHNTTDGTSFNQKKSGRSPK